MSSTTPSYALGTASPESGLTSYPTYKPSELGWLAEIPDSWSAPRLGFVTEVNPPKGSVRNEPEDYRVSFVPMEAIGEHGGIDLESERRLSEVLDGYTYFEDGDVLVAKITPCFENGKGALPRNLTSGIGFGSTELHVLRPGDDIDERFLFYLTISDHFRKLGEASMYGAAGQKRVPEEFVFGFRHPLPPFPEQRGIANFLDESTTRIDVLIDKKRRFIQLLEERRTALVAKAVTKGLNPDAPMKDSGVEWLGEIPVHWDTAPVKYVARLETGHTPSRSNDEYWQDCEIPWFTLADVGDLRTDRVERVTETQEEISELGIQNSSARLLPEGTVMLSRTASVGFSAIMGRPMATSQDFVNWVCGEDLLPEYLLYVFRAMRPELRRLVMGSTHKTIYMPDIEGLRTPLPPLDEQRRIVNEIHKRSHDLLLLLDNVHEAIDTLIEYRSALIAAAVTGKIDVRDHAADR